MEALLRNDFTSHYGAHPSTGITSNRTNALYFELKDDPTLIYDVEGQGVAKYENSNAYDIVVINYELFVCSLPPAFLQSREMCDLITYSNNNKYFLLNELTDTLPKYTVPYLNSKGSQIGKRAKAISQLSNSLNDLMIVKNIKAFIESYSVKQCCFFNKQSMSPPAITATTAFNRINTIATNGFKMTHSAIELLGFELYEYSGSQTYKLN